MSYEIKALSPTCTRINVDFKRNKQFEQWVLLSSDRHLDNPHSLRKLQKKHLDEAKERKAMVCDFGDLFCAMQSRGDRRGRKGDVGNHSNDYLGELVRDATDFLEPYSENLAIIAPGNHEAKLLTHLEFDLTSALCDRLKDKGSRVVRGSYSGWCQFGFSDGPYQQGLNLFYSHGSGGGGAVTRGVISTARRAVYLPDAEIVVSGHVHESWTVEIMRDRLTKLGVEYIDTQTHICLPTYKEEYFQQKDGFHRETEKPPKPVGAWWIRFYWDKTRNSVQYEIQRAK